jgi:hypothetical protein
LVTEVLNKIEKIFIFNKKEMSKDNKKSYVIIIIEILEVLTLYKEIQKHNINIKGGQTIAIEEIIADDMGINKPLPYIEDKITYNIRTLYSYSILNDITLALGINY